MTADDRSHTADALTEVADYHVAECIDMHGDQGEDGPRPDCCFHARAAYAVGDAARLLRTTPTDSERASTHSAECWRWHGDCARARLVEVTAEREAEEPARPENADYWRDRLNDHKASLAIQALTAPDEDEAVMMESLVARIGDLLAERDEARRQIDALRNAIEKLIPWAESYRMHHVVMALRELLALAAVGSPEDAVLSWLKGRSFGSIRVNEVTFALDQSADGQPLVRFTVTLDDPEPGQETWPFDDIQSMLRSIDDQAVAEGIESRWSTSFQQTSPEDFSTDDDLSEGRPVVAGSHLPTPWRLSVTPRRADDRPS